MTRSLKDLIATVLTLVAVLVFIANHEDWAIWLVGDSRGWAAAVITLLGAATCSLGSPEEGSATKWLAALGVLALILAAVALVTGSLTALSLLVADIVALWALSTIRHVLDVGHKPLTT
jgi:chromate transport protein ChrA